jgi:hypothetical protein
MTPVATPSSCGRASFLPVSSGPALLCETLLLINILCEGLLSLAVEFFRLQPTPCPTDDAGTPISNVISHFPYNVTCGLTCNVTSGPFSPMRGGSANNIYVIPAPDKLTFGAATLLAAACCIPAILSMVSMWNKILEINWKTRFEEPTNEPIEGTNGATVEKMKGINSLIRSWLSAVEIPVFGLAVLAILIVGEMNFFSHQLRYQSEPMAAIGRCHPLPLVRDPRRLLTDSVRIVGQWAPMVGTALAVLGSLYLLLAAEPEAKKDEATPDASPHPCHCNCSMQQVGTGPSAASSHSVTIPVSASMRQTLSNDTEETSIEIVPTTSQPAPDHGHPMKRSWTIDDAGYRRKVANSLTELANYVGTAAPNRFDISEFRRGRAVDFPEIPGEEHRNRALPQIREQYNQTRDADGYITPVGRESRSRASSFNDSIASGRGIGGSTTPRSASPQPPHSSRSPSPVPSLTIPRRPHASTFPVLRTSIEQPNSPSSPTAGSSGVGLRPRRDTLEVPSPTHRSTSRNGPSALSISSAHNVPQGMSSPTIVVSSDPDTSPAHTPISSAPTPPSPSEYPTINTNSNVTSLVMIQMPHSITQSI